MCPGNWGKPTLRSELIARLSEMKIKTQKNSPTLTLFVRYVFSSDRKRAHGYSYVLNAAISHGITAAQLPQWIVSEGGIEEIKRKMVQSDESKERQAKRKQAKDTAEQMIAEAHVNPIATVAVDGFIPNQRNILGALKFFWEIDFPEDFPNSTPWGSFRELSQRCFDGTSGLFAAIAAPKATASSGFISNFNLDFPNLFSNLCRISGILVDPPTRSWEL